MSANHVRRHAISGVCVKAKKRTDKTANNSEDATAEKTAERPED